MRLNEDILGPFTEGLRIPELLCSVGPNDPAMCHPEEGPASRKAAGNLKHKPPSHNNHAFNDRFDEGATKGQQVVDPGGDVAGPQPPHRGGVVSDGSRRGAAGRDTGGA